MKYILCFFSILAQCQQVKAQNVGIGTSSPNSSAMLHVSSTTKGLLIPSMSTTQRNDIAAPAEGLIIYNTSTNQLNQRQNGAWKFILNNDYWVGGGSGQMFNIGDKVGINTAGPQERLDVNGNIRTSSSLIINNVSSILQLQNAGVDKGFVQLSGNNLRLGTNGGNSDGNIVLRLDGNNIAEFRKTNLGGTIIQLNSNSSAVGILQTTSTGNVSLTAVNNNAQLQLGGEVFINNTNSRTGIGTSSPTERLHVNGNMVVNGNIVVNGNAVIDDGRITSTSTGSAYNLLPLAYGRVTEAGNKAGGTANFTSATRISEGEYVVFVDGVTASSIIMITPYFNGCAGTAHYISPGKFGVNTTYSDDQADSHFHFLIFNP